MPDLTQLLSTQSQVVRLLSVPTTSLPGGKILLQFDACMEEEHKMETTPTEFEVETGETISDHVIIKPRQLHLKVFVTDTPLSLLGNLLTTGIGAALSLTGESASKLGKFAPALALTPGLGESPNDPTTPVTKKSRLTVQAFKSLEDIIEGRMPVNVWTTLKLYKNMWVKKVSVPRDPKTGRSLSINIDLIQLLLVQPDTISLTALNRADIAATTKLEGNQSLNGAGLNRLKSGIDIGYSATHFTSLANPLGGL